MPNMADRADRLVTDDSSVIKARRGSKIRLVEQKMRARGFDPVDAMIDLLVSGYDATVEKTDEDGESYTVEVHFAQVPLDVRVTLLKELAQYVYPKRKAIELESDDGPARIVVLSGVPGSPGSAAGVDLDF